MSIFNQPSRETIVCTNCGYETRADVEDCPSCSNWYRKHKLSSGRNLFMHGVVALVLSLIPLVAVGNFLLNYGFAAFQKARGYHVALLIGWMLLVKGLLWTISGSRIQSTGTYSAARNNVFLAIEIAAYAVPVFLYFYYAFH